MRSVVVVVGMLGFWDDGCDGRGSGGCVGRFLAGGGIVGLWLRPL